MKKLLILVAALANLIAASQSQMKYRSLIISMFAMMLFANISYAQTYVNKEWVKSHGAPDTIEWTASTIDIWGQLITAGNTLINGQYSNILITKFDEEGNILWQQDWNGNKGKSDYGAAIITDNNGYIYIAGASQYSNDSIFDIVLLKYDWQGVLQWEANYDGTGGADYPVEMAIDQNGYVYITGASEGVSSDLDFITLKYDNNGNLEWDARYDYNQNIDIAADIIAEENGETITVTGGSEDTAGVWDYTTISYDNNGNQTNIVREASDDTDIKKPKDIVKDINKNYYITGIKHNGTDNDIKLLKLDSTLQTQWVQIYNQNNEGSNVLAIDIAGNLYIGGWQEEGPGYRQFLLLKYNNNGILLWQQILMPVEDKPIAEITGITVDTDEVVTVIGFATNGTNSDIVTAQFNPDGDLAWLRKWENMAGSVDFPTSIQQVEDDIYVSGSTNGILGTKWVTIKYSFSTRTSDIVEDTISNQYYKGNQLIIWFDPSIVDTNFINNKEMEFSVLSDIIPSAVLLEMSEKSNINFWESPQKTYKLMTRMTSADSISISRMGDTIRMQPFWSAFIVETPPYNELELAADSLATLSEYILYAGTAKVAFLNDIPNDNLFIDEQESLFPTLNFPNAHINVEPAWDIEQGQDFIRVGVFDFTIFWAHPDFGDGTFAGSKIAGGWDWISNSAIANVPHPTHSHGTSVAGIIGALRNNNEGIAGIAGGDVLNNNTGVQLFSMGLGFIDMSTGAALIDGAAAISAIIEGAAWNPNTGFGFNLHVQNHSWGGYQFDALQQAALESCSRNQCIFVASRGNNGIPNLSYPACHRDELVINVGASGTDGEHFDGINIGNGDGFIPIQNQWGSNFGGNIDVIAPGVTDIVAAPHDPTVPFDFNGIFGAGSCTVQDINNNYSCFHGTSAAAPHVSGVAALMLSHHHPNNNFANGLAPEDVEHLIQNHANDIAGGQQNYPVGYDQWNGWGRIDAYETMKHIEFPQYRIYHNGSGGNLTSTQTTQNQQIFIGKPINGLSTGSYLADLVEVTYTYNDIFPTSTQILDGWGRESSSNGFSSNNFIDEYPEVNYTFSINNNTATTTAVTHCWYVTTFLKNGQTINQWIPAHPSQLVNNYSLHLFDPNATLIEEIAENSEVTIYPVPADDQIKIEGKLPGFENITIEIHDVQGRLILSRNIGKVKSINETLPVEGLPSSIYFCIIKGERTYVVEKFMKQ